MDEIPAHRLVREAEEADRRYREWLVRMRKEINARCDWVRMEWFKAREAQRAADLLH